MSIKFIEQYTFESTQYPLIKTSRIRDFLLSQEENILKNVPWQSDYNTGLKNTDVLTRSGAYNVFDAKYMGACPDLQDLLIFIRNCYSDYILKVLPNKTFVNNTLTPQINAWLSVLRNNESLYTHQHTFEHDDLWSFVSGTMCLDAKETSTVYNYVEQDWDGMSDMKSPSDAVFGSKVIENKPGTLTLFPPFYFHSSTRNVDYTRVSIGMDIFFHKSHLAEDSVHKNACRDLPDYNLMLNE